MNFGTPLTQQLWSCEKLVRECAIALGNAIDHSTLKSYHSAFNSYLAFVILHQFPIEPTADTLSFFTVYMCHHINPWSVNSYLSRLVQQLKPFFPNVKEARNSCLVQKTLCSCMKSCSLPTVRKQPLTTTQLQQVLSCFKERPQHDNLLFLATLFTGFSSLLRLGELCFPDDHSIHNWQKFFLCSSLKLFNKHFEFLLPAHKANRYFEGNKVVVQGDYFNLPTFEVFSDYIASRDSLFPLASPLWITKDGSVPTHSFFMKCLRHFFRPEIAGQSMRAGGATALTELGVPLFIIQAAGR